MSFAVVACMESIARTARSRLLAEFFITVSGSLPFEFSIVKTVLRFNSSIFFERNATVSKLASDSAEQPENAAKYESP